MRQPARLITPEGKAIDLPQDVYRQVKRLLDTRPARRSHVRVAAAIQQGYGLLGGGDSLTQALLDEHALERARDEKKLSWLKDEA